jgi:hypothetical protein
MNLHQDTKLFQQAVRATAEQTNIAPIYVEKDYWVTLALYSIFTSDIGQHVVFKGGTALSKCYRLIERFSEDIDLVVLRHGEESANKLKNRLKEISKVVEKQMPEVNLENVTNKMGQIRKTAHDYPKLFNGKFGQVRDKVIVESSWLGHYEPYHQQEVSAYIYDMMINAGQSAMAEQHGLLPFTLNVLDARRTMCEKILSLVRFSYDQDPVASLRLKIRHLYDLHQLLLDETLSAFFISKEFEDMLNRVGADDVEGYKNNNEWLNQHPSEALIFKKPQETWAHLKSTYLGDFSNLIYGTVPSELAILNQLTVISDRLSQIIWNVST